MPNERVIAVALSGRGFMMVYNRARGGWEFPGGEVMDDEEPLDAAVREFHEETGLTFRPLGPESAEENGLRVFYGTAAGERAVPPDPGISEARWFRDPPEELAFGADECRRVILQAVELLPPDRLED